MDSSSADFAGLGPAPQWGAWRGKRQTWAMASNWGSRCPW